VGGKLEAPEGSDSPSLSGIFIKNVLSGSPAAATNQLNTGDRIIAVGDVDLRYASHDKVRVPFILITDLHNAAFFG
jgi:hypothetical protein